MQSIITAGDTLDFLTTVVAYPPADGWTLKYRLVPRVSGTPIVLTAVPSGTNYRVQASPATTAGWTAGNYSWAAWVEKSGARYVVDEGAVEIKPDPGVIAAYDGRSTAARALEDAMSALASFQASGGRVKRYTINGREVEYDTAGEFVALVNFWKLEVAKETAASLVAQGQPDPRRIYLRMSNA